MNRINTPQNDKKSYSISGSFIITEEEPWFIITNLDNASEVIKYYKMRGGIEAMFRDYKSGGYNLEGSFKK